MNIRTFFLLSLIVPVVSFAQVPYPGNDSDHGVTAGGFPNPYTGNVSFSTNDIIVAGAVGQYGLTWQRYGTSRTSQAEDFFGLGHNWTHNWQWEMVAEGQDSQGRSIISVREPYGAVHRFAETSPGQWWSTPDVTDRVVSSGDTFTLVKRGGGEARFTRQGDVFALQELADDQGNVWKLIYSAGRLVQVTEPAGRWLKINYKTVSAPKAAAGTPPFMVISSVTASDGQTVVYSYQFPIGVDYPVLAKATYPDENTAAYTYAEPRAGARLLLTQADDPRGGNNLRGRMFRYRSEPDAAVGQIQEVDVAEGGAVMQALAADSRDMRAYAVTQTNGAITYQTYNPGGNVAETIDALGFSRKYEYDANGRGAMVATTDGLGKVTRYEFNVAGDLARTTFTDKTSRSWERDAQGRVLTETDELGNIIRYTLDARGRVTQTRYPDGATEKATYNDFGKVLTSTDRSGAIITRTYSRSGLHTKSANALGASDSIAYDARDRMQVYTDTHGNVTRYERDAAGRVTRTIYADGSDISISFDKFGQIVQTVDASGFTSLNSFDTFGRLISTVDPLGNKTRNEYAPIGDNASFDQPIRAVFPSGRVNAMVYDPVGRVISRTIAAGTPKAAITRIAYNANGQPISLTNALGRTVQFFYDERGRSIKTISMAGFSKTSTYDAAGHKLSETDAKGNTTKWTYDVAGRVLTETDAKGQVTRRKYDSAGQLADLIDANRKVYRFEYDLLGRQTALVYPDGSRETTEYDAGGLKLRYINRAGAVQTFAYDSRNREISSEWSDGSQTLSKEYDGSDRLVSVDNGASKLIFTYNQRGLLSSETQDIARTVTGGVTDPQARTIRYTYNADGDRETLSYPDGSFIKFSYDMKGQLAEILAEGVSPPLARYEYDAAGNATLMPRLNDTETKREFDGENRMITVTERTTGRRSPLTEIGYAYDEVGNRVSTVESTGVDTGGIKPARRNAYQYDEINQVIGADSLEATERFTYDAVGNRLATDENGKVTRYAVNGLNQYTQVGEFAPTYDLNGNLSGMGKWLYRYDALNRLISVSNGHMTARFFYDAKNRCIARKYEQFGSANGGPSSSITLNTYDNWNLIEERDGSGTQQARYVHGQRTDEIVTMVNKLGIFYPHYDALGNVTMLTGNDGRLVERYTYSATGQGRIVDAAGQTLVNSAVGNRWMFTGREWLQPLELYDYRNRIYSADLGRFLQTDPIRFGADDVNIYRYVANRYTYIGDPSGLYPGQLFNSANVAAMDASNYFRGNYGYAMTEYGTVIQSTGVGTYFYNNFVTQGQAHTVTITANSATVATWHNHPTSNNFSATDIAGSYASGTNGYVLTPTNAVKLYDRPNSWWDSFLIWTGIRDPVSTVGYTGGE